MDRPEGVRMKFCDACHDEAFYEGGCEEIKCQWIDKEGTWFSDADLAQLIEWAKEEARKESCSLRCSSHEAALKAEIDQLEAEVEAIKLDRAAILTQHQNNQVGWEKDRNKLEADLAAAQKRVEELERVEWQYKCPLYEVSEMAVQIGIIEYCPWCKEKRSIVHKGDITGDHAPDCVRRK